MPLPLEGPRPLSPLEREAVELVFWDSIDPCDVYLTVLPVRMVQGKNKWPASYRNRKITINRSKFPYTDALGIKSTLANTEDKVKPGNMDYLCRVIHECAHHWQSVHNKYPVSKPLKAKAPPYGISLKQLTRMKFIREENPFIQDPENFPEKHHELYREQHASAAQVYFVIEWQLKYSTDPLVNLTTFVGEPYVGPVSRYDRIDDIKHAGRDDLNPPDDCNAAPPGRRVSRECAMDIANDFNVYLKELRRWGG